MPLRYFIPDKLFSTTNNYHFNIFNMDNDDLLATTNHDIILEWCRANQGIPVVLKSKDEKGQKQIAVDFSGRENNTDDSIAITWEEWLRIFEKKKLVFIYSKHTGSEVQKPYYSFASRQEQRILAARN